MFTLKKICTSTFTGVYKYPMKTVGFETVLAISVLREPLLYMISNITTSTSLNCSKVEDVKKRLVRLSSKTYDVPDKVDTTIPVIILHGLLGSKNNWNSMCRALHLKTKNRTIIALDCRNHGDSPHTDEFTYEIMVSDLIYFMEYQGISKASYVGHSLGGRTAMLLSLLHPELVHSLVVVDISPLGQSPQMLELPKLFNMIKNLDLNPKLSLQEARKKAGKQLKEQLKDDNLVNFLLANLDASTGDTTWRWKFNIDSISNNFPNEVCRFPRVNSEYMGPTLFIAGQLSDYIKPEAEDSIKEMFPAAKFVYIPGAGHWVHAEKPAHFLTAVTDFLLDDSRS